MKRVFWPVASVCLLISSVLTNYAAGGEYFFSREGSKKEFEFSQILKQGHEAKQRTFNLEQIQGPKTHLNGIDAYPMIVRTTEPSKDPVLWMYFFLENDQGLKLVASQGPLDKSPTMVDRDLWTFMYPLAVGTTWTRIEEVPYWKEKVSIPLTCVIEAMDDDVTVPAGTFKKCMKIKQYFSGKVNLGSYRGEPEVTFERYSWFAPGIGHIKTTLTMRCSNAELGEGESHQEMISYKN